MPPRSCAFLILPLALFGCFDTGTSTDSAPSAEKPISLPTSSRWICTTSMEQDLGSERIVLALPRADSMIMTEERAGIDGNWETSDTFYVGRIAEIRGERIRLEGARGKLVRRNPEGWLRIHPGADGLEVHVVTHRMVGDNSGSGFPVGSWTGSALAQGGALDIRADGHWVLRPAAGESVSGEWYAGPWPGSAALQEDGIAPYFADYLAGRRGITLLSDNYLYDGNASELWLDKIGDGSLVHFAPVP